ncbi:hypothetical protein RN001_011322 [Aquatica leii]|uniref:CRAL-TRIO domain-containing protein n=1 Tax=Aquatica leii TaxID=1421715 RepID=A0AAN7PAZ6_9COLE|nr:hypothetical protein RN001_011322 [Aquatica leii]
MSALTFGFTKNEIIEEKRVTEDKINNVRDWLMERSYPNLKDEQIIIFLVSCLNDLDLTKKTIKSYYAAKTDAPEMFTCRSVENEDLRQILDVIYCFPLPVRTDNNCVIIVLRLKDSDYQNYDTFSASKLNIMVVESVVRNYPPNGSVVLFDFCNVSLMHLTKINLNVLRIYLNYMQECLPLKLHVVHFFNCGSIFNIIFNLVKPFLTEEVFEKLQFHKGNLDNDEMELSGIGKSLLPKDYGGELESLDYYQKSYKKKLVELQPFFEAEIEQWFNKDFDFVSNDL